MGRIQTFSGNVRCYSSLFNYLIVPCTSAVCVLDTLALSISIIQEIGNINRKWIYFVQ